MDELLTNLSELQAQQNTVLYKIHRSSESKFSAQIRVSDLNAVDTFSREGVIVQFMTVQKRRLLRPALS